MEDVFWSEVTLEQLGRHSVTNRKLTASAADDDDELEASKM